MPARGALRAPGCVALPHKAGCHSRRCRACQAQAGRTRPTISTCASGFFFFQAEDGIRDDLVTGVQTCALPIWLRMIAARLATQLDVLELQSKIQSQVKENIDKSQRRYYLQEQMKAIRKELGEGEPGGGSEIESLRVKLIAAKLPENVMKEATRELSRLESIPSASPEYGVIRTWLQIVSELPWAVSTQDHLDLKEARNILDRD